MDYAYVAIGAEWVPGLLAAAAGNVAFAQVITSGFREEGNAELEDRLVATAHAARVRLVGPNCLGTYSPRDRSLTFPVDAPTEPGRIGIVTQSGGLGTDIIKRGQWKGLGLSALVTAGNCADVGPADLVEFYLADDRTDAIGLYLEDVGDGRRFFDLLRGALRVDGSPELDDAKRRYCALARDAGIPVFDELPEAARALAAVAHLERALGRRRDAALIGRASRAGHVGRRRDAALIGRASRAGHGRAPRVGYVPRADSPLRPRSARPPPLR